MVGNSVAGSTVSWLLALTSSLLSCRASYYLLMVWEEECIIQVLGTMRGCRYRKDVCQILQKGRPFCVAPLVHMSAAPPSVSAKLVQGYGDYGMHTSMPRPESSGARQAQEDAGLVCSAKLAAQPCSCTSCSLQPGWFAVRRGA